MSEELKATLEKGLSQVSADLSAKMAEHTAMIEQNGKASTALTGQVDALAEQYKSLDAQIVELAQKSAGFKGQEQVAQTLGDRFIMADEFKSVASGQSRQARIELKAVVTSDPASNTVHPMQRQGVIAGNFAPLTIRDLLTEIPVSTSSVEGISENVWTNAAAEVAQGAAKPESSITFKQVTTNIKTIAHWIKVSNQLLADAPAVSAYINTRLMDGLAQRVDRQLILGAGTLEIDGLTLAANHTVYTPTAGDNLADAISRAKWALWAAGNVPDVVIVNPADWGAVERMKTVDGVYLFGTPGTVTPEALFNVPVVVSNHVTAGKFIVGSVRSSALIYARQAKTIDLGYVNDDFTKNLVTIRAEERLALHVDRPSAILYGSFTSVGG